MFNIVLLEPEIPANTGNIGRTCLVTGSRLHLIEPMGFILNDKNLKRAGMDYWEHLDVTRYVNFQEFLEKHPNAKVSEMDTVEGTKGGKVILTIFLRDCSVQIMLLRETKTAAGVAAAYAHLREVMGDSFSAVFEVILVDRGTEFTDPSSIEIDQDTGEFQCNVFYCDPQQTNQKSRCERNHEFIRYILPKGSSFDDLAQDDVTLMMNHINSLPRASLNARSPYQVFEDKYGSETAAKLGLKYIPLKELCLKPELIKK